MFGPLIQAAVAAVTSFRLLPSVQESVSLSSEEDHASGADDNPFLSDGYLAAHDAAYPLAAPAVSPYIGRFIPATTSSPVADNGWRDSDRLPSLEEDDASGEPFDDLHAAIEYARFEFGVLDDDEDEDFDLYTCTGCGMYSTKQGAEHACLIVDGVREVGGSFQ